MYADLLSIAHSTIAGAARFAIKVAFIPLSAEGPEIFSGGEPETQLIRVVALIKSGRDADTRARLLTALHAVFVQFAPRTFGAEITLVENRAVVSSDRLNPRVPSFSGPLGDFPFHSYTGQRTVRRRGGWREVERVGGSLPARQNVVTRLIFR